MTRQRALPAGLLSSLLAVALSLWTYPFLPQRVPTHWDLAGHVNGYSSRMGAVTLLPAIDAFMWLLIVILPVVSPRRSRLEQSASAFYACMLAALVLVLIMHFLLLRAALTGQAPSMTLVFAVIGALLTVIGCYLGRLKKNFWLGVRTPWTLASDEGWHRTNRLAGQLFIVGGIAIVIASFSGTSVIVVLIAVIAAVAVVSITFSYLLYRRIEGFGAGPSS